MLIVVLQGPTEEQLGEVGSLLKYCYYYYIIIIIIIIIMVTAVNARHCKK